MNIGLWSLNHFDAWTCWTFVYVNLLRRTYPMNLSLIWMFTFSIVLGVLTCMMWACDVWVSHGTPSSREEWHLLVRVARAHQLLFIFCSVFTSTDSLLTHEHYMGSDRLYPTRMTQRIFTLEHTGYPAYSRLTSGTPYPVEPPRSTPAILFSASKKTHYCIVFGLWQVLFSVDWAAQQMGCWSAMDWEAIITSCILER
jgi:hypothetical protein